MEKEHTITGNNHKMSRSQKAQLILASILTVATIAAIPVAAWFAFQKEMGISTKVNSPATLEIKSGGPPGSEQDIINFELSDIDTEDKTFPFYTDNGVTYYYKDFVFCVKGKAIDAYDLQLAHTTNIAFRYDIYSAVPDDNGMIVYMPKNEDIQCSQNYRLAKIKTDSNGVVLDENDDPIYEDYETPLDGQYVNVETVGNRIIANKSKSLDLTARSYDVGENGDNLQKYANPAYWIKRNIPIYAVEKTDNGFTHPYILRISWVMPASIDDSEREENLDIVQNNKETDMIYITAKAQG